MSNGNTVVLDRSIPVAVAAVLAALWFWKTHTKKRVPAPVAAAIVWEEGIVFPKQHLWKGIASYARTSGPPGACGPVLAFRSEKVGLGDRATMAAITARFRPRPTDLHVVTYPKAGTSWIQEVAWLVNHGADLHGSRSVLSGQRTVYIELSRPGVDKLAALDSAVGPRHIKWHHPAWLLPPAVPASGRVIYVYRNPKDTVVSWFHFQRMNPLYEFTGTFDEFFELFLADQTAYGSYWENLRSWWALRRQPNILVLSYEQMHADLDGVVRYVAAFVGKELTQDQVAAICAHCSLDSMRSNPMTNASAMAAIAGEGQFLRKGVVGNWREYLSADQDARMDAWAAKNTCGAPMIYG